MSTTTASKIKIKVGIIGGIEMDNPDVLKTSMNKPVKSTPYGKPSDDLTLGKIEGVDCVILARQGRKYDIVPGNINYRANIWALKQEGCTHIIATAAADSLQEDLKRGDIVILNGFIDRTENRKQSFYDGEKHHPPGRCHIPMDPAFDEKTRNIIIHSANELEIAIQPMGTVICVQGPRYSSRAESRMFRQWGAHLINMTFVPEMILAKEAGICYAAIAVIVTDCDCLESGPERRVTSRKVFSGLKKQITRVNRLLTIAVRNIGRERWEQTLDELEDLIKDNIIA